MTAQPQCILCDEVDGPAGDVIAQLAMDTKKPLLRPVICTANEMYAPLVATLCMRHSFDTGLLTPRLR